MNEDVALEVDLYFQIARVMLGIAVIALAIGSIRLLQGHYQRVNILFTVYLLAVVLQGGTTLTYHYLGYPNAFYLVGPVTANLFSVLEFCLFNLIFFQILKSTAAKVYIKLSTVLFPIICMLYWFGRGSIADFSFHLSVVEAFLILIVCLTYFYELFVELPTKNLIEEPFFWFATGVLVYFVCMIPTFLVLEYVDESEWHGYASLEISNFLASITLYIFIVKALLCKTQQTKLS